MAGLIMVMDTVSCVIRCMVSSVVQSTVKGVVLKNTMSGKFSCRQQLWKKPGHVTLPPTSHFHWSLGRRLIPSITRTTDGPTEKSCNWQLLVFTVMDTSLTHFKIIKLMDKKKCVYYVCILVSGEDWALSCIQLPWQTSLSWDGASKTMLWKKGSKSLRTILKMQLCIIFISSVKYYIKSQWPN